MGQRHMPLGYQMKDGKVVIVPENADLIKELFKAYSQGASLHQLARKLTEQGALNANHKPVWNHGTVGKILENQRYLGDDFYPAILEQELFEAVQERRKERGKKLGRIMQSDRVEKRSMFANRLVCGICGQPYRRYVEHSRQPGEKTVWKCKHYINENRVSCKNVFLTDSQIIDAFMELLNLLKSQRFRVEPKEPMKRLPYSLEAAELTRRLQELEETPGYSGEEMVRIIYERARIQYRTARIRDQDYQTERLKAALEGGMDQDGFNREYFKTIVSRMVVYKDKKFEFELANGVKIELSI